MIDDIEKQHLIEKALNTLEEYKVYVVKKTRNGRPRMEQGFPVSVKACGKKDALQQALNQLSGDGDQSV